MPQYDIFAVCNACGAEHPVGVATLQTGPRQRQSVTNAFPGDELPSELTALKTSRIYCPKTGKHYAQIDYKRIFLVPIGYAK